MSHVDKNFRTEKSCRTDSCRAPVPLDIDGRPKRNGTVTVTYGITYLQEKAPVLYRGLCDQHADEWDGLEAKRTENGRLNREAARALWNPDA